MHPHFALSAIFLLGLRGIRKQIPLALPPVGAMRARVGAAEGQGPAEGQGAAEGPGAGAVGAVGVVRLARSLEEATKLFGREGSVAREVFGDAFVEHYRGTREHEVELWNQTVTNWEGASSSRLLSV
jgi:glutamine synthetase